eukprot:CAMPEP_0196823890 /NCGR_PEP_ID=MMETSP1362-20130617/89483_1 /TAXON_ID=163516 /ORGANISM="Leptocylindrus danicus, Strain CCMP1856" /LENGTH=553 /DNA_ID=CAMNT_0042203937 /DNA_START=326 /DNA_END=1987 /DNA_ORIENTATION=+
MKELSKARFGSTKGISRVRGGAIVSSTPGTTRDRRESIGRIGPCYFRMLDTAGVDGDRLDAYHKQKTKKPKKQKSQIINSMNHRDHHRDLTLTLTRSMLEQTMEAVRASDLVLLMFDARVGVTSDVTEIARWLRKITHEHVSNHNAHRKVVVLANKLEGDRWAVHDDVDSPILEHLAEASRAGFGEAIPISAEHGEGLTDLAVIVDELTRQKMERLGISSDPTTEEDKNKDKKEEDHVNKPLQLAILGRQNVGKSTLVNALLKQERVITGELAGLTRDAIAVEWSWEGRPVKLVDTAGIRKISQRVHDDSIEDLAVLDAVRAMKVADVAVLVLDAAAGMLQRHELAIADAVVKEGRALVVAANKWDILEDDVSRKEFAEGVSEQIEVRLPMLRRTPVVAMSSLRGDSVEELMPVVFNARDRWQRKISTGLLNRWLLDIVENYPPPLTKGRPTKIKYVVQTKGRPPTFLLFCNVLELPLTYIRFLSKHFQDSFEMFGMEVRFAVKLANEGNPFNTKQTRGGGSGIGGAEARKLRNIALLKSGQKKPTKKRRRRR